MQVWLLPKRDKNLDSSSCLGPPPEGRNPSGSETAPGKKTKTKKNPPPVQEEEEESDEEDDESGKDEILKTFLESVVNLVREVRPVRKRKKKEATTDLMKSLKNLLK